MRWPGSAVSPTSRRQASLQLFSWLHCCALAHFNYCLPQHAGDECSSSQMCNSQPAHKQCWSASCVDAAEEEDSLKQAPRAADQPREDSNIWVSALTHVGYVPKLLNCIRDCGPKYLKCNNFGAFGVNKRGATWAVLHQIWNTVWTIPWIMLLKSSIAGHDFPVN